MGRRCIKRRKSKRAVVVLLLAFLLIITFACDRYFLPILKATATDAAASKVNIAVNQAIGEIMAEKSEEYSGITNVVYDKDNNVKAIETNPIKLNSLKSELESKLGERTHEITQGEVKVSLGTLMGYEYTIGCGIKIPLKFDIENLTIGEYSDKFESAGINQTRHSIILKIVTDIIVIIPWDIQTKSVETDAVIAQTVIVGEIPNSYTNVNVNK